MRYDRHRRLIAFYSPSYKLSEGKPPFQKVPYLAEMGLPVYAGNDLRRHMAANQIPLSGTVEFAAGEYYHNSCEVAKRLLFFFDLECPPLEHPNPCQYAAVKLRDAALGLVSEEYVRVTANGEQYDLKAQVL